MIQTLFPSQAAKRPGSRPVTVLNAAVAALLALGVAGVSPGLARSPEAVTPMPVRTQIVEFDDYFKAKEIYTGRIVARRESALAFDRSGRMAEILVEEGASVAAGDVLARLDTRDLEAEKLLVEAQREEARARLTLARNTAKRQEALLARNNASAQRYDEALTERRAATANLKSIEAQLVQIDVALDLSRIVAPYAGKITARMADEGAVAAPGTPVLELVESGALEFRVGLPSDLVGDLKIGDTVQIQTDQGPRPVSLERKVTQIDAATRTVLAIFSLSAEESAVLPGALASLTLERTLQGPGFWVPLAALSEGRRGLWSLLVVEGDPDDDTLGSLVRRPVEVLHFQAERAFVRGLVSEGERILATGGHRVVERQQVVILEDVAAPPRPGSDDPTTEEGDRAQDTIARTQLRGQD